MAKERKYYDQGKVLKLWEAGKSIKEIAEAMKPIARIYVHRLLSTKFKVEYQAGVKARDAAKPGGQEGSQVMSQPHHIAEADWRRISNELRTRNLLAGPPRPTPFENAVHSPQCLFQGILSRSEWELVAR
jgi:hypothetical protein